MGISMRTSGCGDTQRKLAETARGERHAEHDRGEDELVKSCQGRVYSQAYVASSGDFWKTLCWGKALTFIVKWVWRALLLYMADDCSGR